MDGKYVRYHIGYDYIVPDFLNNALSDICTKNIHRV